MEKRKIYGMIIGIVVFALMIVGLTYAYFYWSSGEDEDTFVKLTVNKDIEGFIVYDPGTSIGAILDEELEGTLEYSEDYKTSNVNTVITLGKTASASSLNLYGQLFLEIIGDISNDGNVKNTDLVNWTLTYTVDSSDTNYTDNCTVDANAGTKECVIGSGNLYGKDKGDKIPLIDYISNSTNVNDIELSSTNMEYKFYIWFKVPDSTYEINANSSGEEFDIEISASASTESSRFGTQPSVVLANLGLDDDLKNDMIDYSSVSTDADSGLFISTDDFGISYYFRGNATNNYVKFGKNSAGNDMYWRIIRINGNGTIRMIYDGTSVYSNGTSNSNKSPVSSAYKSTPYGHNTYIGYMYGDTTGTTFATVHTNATNSTIKTALDNWYRSNILNTGYNGYVSDAVYCNDRSVYSGDGLGTTETNYGSYKRLTIDNSPSLKCVNNGDRFTISSSLGNGKLTYPVGLITADEVVMAGGVNGVNNVTYYLRSGSFFYTMTPYNFAGSIPYVFGVGGSGNVTKDNVYTSYTVRPVISLRADAINYDAVTAGTAIGTASLPFVIK